LKLDDKQLICSPRRELSIGMLKVQKIKCLIFWGHVPPLPIELKLDDKQLICSPRRELSIGMLKVQKIKCLIFWGHVPH
jgi:hypothetical protein